MKLLCTNESCDGKDQPMFNINTTVGDEGELTENLRTVGGEYFDCAHCGSGGKWVSEQDNSYNTSQQGAVLSEG